MTPSPDTAILRSIHVGLPAHLGTPDAFDPLDRPWFTGLFKQPVHAPVHLRREHLDGDGQADLEHHGGTDRAVCVYPAAHYATWTQRLQRDLPPGAFGENFSIDGLDEDTVCIGDRFRVGDAIVEVSQPRSPCWKVARRWREPRLARWIQETGRTGWYLRVLAEGTVAPGQSLVRVERPNPDWTIRRTNALRYDPRPNPDLAADLARCRALPDAWRQRLLDRAHGRRDPDESSRLFGDNPRG